MYTRFHDNTITTKFIKELIAKTNVPYISTWKPGDFAVRGMFYLTKDAIWKCLHTGTPNSIDDICPENHPSHTSDSDFTEDDLRFFVRVSPYVFGHKYFNLTGTYESKILGYDSTTHFYLGQYLRMMRDIYGLDLMPFYNCFGGEYLSDISFDEYGKVYQSTSDSNYYKILSVPVRFGLKYMIAIDSEIPIECICAIYGPKGFIKDLTDNLNDINTSDSDNKHNTYMKYQRMQFQRPHIYSTPTWHQLYSPSDAINNEDKNLINDKTYDQRLGLFERYLRLLIKVPKSNKSSITIIEGDYSLYNGIEYIYLADISDGENLAIYKQNINATWSNRYLYGSTVNSKTVSGDWIRTLFIKNTSSETIDIANPIEALSLYPQELRKLLSPLGLLLLNDGNIYAFSNRLVEYLTQNAINHLESFNKNISRVQEYAKSEILQIKNGDRYYGNIVPGVWDTDFLTYVFNLVQNSTILDKKVDLTGFIDKDAETVITRGLEV